MKNSRSKIMSKRGFTLVELVVTMAILSIASALGIGVIARTITNYSEAATTEQEQNTARQIELALRDAAMLSKKIDYFTDATTGNFNPTTGKPKKIGDGGVYFIADKTNKLVTVYNFRDSAEKDSKITYTGVKQITVTPKRVKKKAAVTVDAKTDFLMLDYRIEMVQGFVIKGSIVLNGIKANQVGTDKLYNPDPTGTNIGTGATSIDGGKDIPLVSAIGSVNKSAIFFQTPEMG